ncbi:hypothetical protein OUZ56_005520 [Daphnia magna]|uniref:Uncharacterized protein n=1 Tax=Daphnia magna TaxID=35525 RepID=A0ABQ9YT14_9CRUS|nr:hypothetical protein OUZ56_005520 [Daphnia magna]
MIEKKAEPSNLARNRQAPSFFRTSTTGELQDPLLQRLPSLEQASALAPVLSMRSSKGFLSNGTTVPCLNRMLRYVAHPESVIFPGETVLKILKYPNNLVVTFHPNFLRDILSEHFS